MFWTKEKKAESLNGLSSFIFRTENIFLYETRKENSYEKFYQ